MPKKEKSRWLNPDKEGRSHGRLSKRYCRRCGTTIQHAPILKGLNICRFCVEDLQKRRDGIWACRGCGAIVPEQLQAHGGYCDACVCPVCGKPAPESVKETGFCPDCLIAAGAFCRSCGVEAPAQVKRNKGLCDKCALKLVSGNTADTPRTTGAKTTRRPAAPGKPAISGKGASSPGPKGAPGKRFGEGPSRPRSDGDHRASFAGQRKEKAGPGTFKGNRRPSDRPSVAEGYDGGRDARRDSGPINRPESRPKFGESGRSGARPGRFTRTPDAGQRTEKSESGQPFRRDNRPGNAGAGRSEERPRRFYGPPGSERRAQGSAERQGPRSSDYRPEGRSEGRPRRFDRPSGPAGGSFRQEPRTQRSGESRDFRPSRNTNQRPQDSRGAVAPGGATNRPAGGFSKSGGPGKRGGSFPGPKANAGPKPDYAGNRPATDGGRRFGSTTGGRRPGQGPKKGGRPEGRRPR